MISFQPFASSSAGNAYLLSDGRSLLLLECGLSWKEIRKAMHFQTSTLAGILVTHEHSDHSRGVKDAMKAGMDVYASAGTFNALGLTGHRRKDVRAHEAFTVGSWTVLPFDIIHDAEEPLGFLLASPEGKCLFLTDTAYSPYRFQGLTHIFVECNHSIKILRKRAAEEGLSLQRKKRLMGSHLSLEQVQKLLAANDLSQVQEIHLLHLSDDNSDAELFKRTIQAQTGKPVYVAER